MAEAEAHAQTRQDPPLGLASASSSKLVVETFGDKSPISHPCKSVAISKKDAWKAIKDSVLQDVDVQDDTR